ncbi:hypothetical protein [Rhodococcus sp. NPDC057529]|uniref:hypothetical protein n=1 Tax=Rhodococcus sp. NPDC057529 TaxID=3346158 RepID=UPI00366E2936
MPALSVGCDDVRQCEPQVWADLARLLGPGELADLFSCAATPPPDWEPVFVLDGRQTIWPDNARAEGCPAESGVIELGADNVPEMRDLVERTHPGPFWPRTHELGAGVRGVDRRRRAGSAVDFVG